MNNNLRKVKTVYSLFYYSAKKQLLSEDTILLSAAVGLYQGLKYKGNFKTGIKGGLATLGTVAAINGVLAVIENKDKFKNL